MENARIKNVSLYDESKYLDLNATKFKYHHVPRSLDFTCNFDHVKEAVQQCKNFWVLILINTLITSVIQGGKEKKLIRML